MEESSPIVGVCIEGTVEEGVEEMVEEESATDDTFVEDNIEEDGMIVDDAVDNGTEVEAALLDEAMAKDEIVEEAVEDPPLEAVVEPSTDDESVAFDDKTTEAEEAIDDTLADDITLEDRAVMVGLADDRLLDASSAVEETMVAEEA